jgi:hypothetical protein
LRKARRLDDAHDALDRCLCPLWRKRGERKSELRDIGVTTVPIFGQAGRDDGFEVVGNIRAVAANGRRRLDGDFDRKLAKRIPFKRDCARQKLEKDHTERPDVGSRIDIFGALYLLGRHVKR